ALYAMAWSLAQIAAPLSGSRIAANFGFNTLWWILAAVCFCSSISIFFLEQKIKSVQQPVIVTA
ncbi:MAG: hypothetical protein JO072_00185, partial [Parafilimonas sp.]|nr:hypothetical protein [Parafilimonas sp.]